MAHFKILDGAMGSELIKRRLVLPKHIWSAEANISHPDLVQQIHREYIDAGADYITTNTFRTTPRAYLKTGVCNQISVKMAKESLLQAVKIAKKVAESSVKVIGSIAPLEDCYEPQLFPGKDLAIAEFAQLGKWFCGTGINILILETMNSMAETESALEALNGFPLPIWTSFVMKDEKHILSGDTLLESLSILNDYHISTVLLNCNPLDMTKRAVDNIVDNWCGEWGIYPNLGAGEPSTSGHITEYEPMVKYLSVIEYALNSGASVVGACCGSSPEHITEIKKLQYVYEK